MLYPINGHNYDLFIKNNIKKNKILHLKFCERKNFWGMVMTTIIYNLMEYIPSLEGSILQESVIFC